MEQRDVGPANRHEKHVLYATNVGRNPSFEAIHGTQIAMCCLPSADARSDTENSVLYGRPADAVTKRMTMHRRRGWKFVLLLRYTAQQRMRYASCFPSPQLGNRPIYLEPNP